MNDSLASRVWQRLQGVVGRGRVTGVDDSGPTQLLQVSSISPGDVLDGARRLAEFGLSSSPPPGAVCIVLFAGGERSNPIVIATGDVSTRPRGLNPGETELYDAFGHTLKLLTALVQLDSGAHPLVIKSEGDNVTIQVASGKHISLVGDVVHTGNYTHNGNMLRNGDEVSFGSMLNNGAPIGSTHEHEIASGAAGTGGLTSPPV